MTFNPNVKNMHCELKWEIASIEEGINKMLQVKKKKANQAVETQWFITFVHYNLWLLLVLSLFQNICLNIKMNIQDSVW